MDQLLHVKRRIVPGLPLCRLRGRFAFQANLISFAPPLQLGYKPLEFLSIDDQQLSLPPAHGKITRFDVLMDSLAADSQLPHAISNSVVIFFRLHGCHTQLWIYD